MNELDSDGNPPKFVYGDRVLVLPLDLMATVIRQQKCYDGIGYWFWGNVKLIYDDGVTGISNSWQLKKVV